MTSLERVIKAARGEATDRIPLDLGSSFVTGITKNAYVNLARAMGRDVGEPELYDVVQQLAVVDEEMLQELDVDVRGLIPNMVRKSVVGERVGDCDVFADEWGVTWKRPVGALYYSAVESELAGEISEADIDRFAWPDTGDAKLFDGLAEEGERYHRAGYAVMLECICAGMFEMCCRVRGVEQFYMDLAMNPSLAVKLMDKFVELKVRFYEAASQYVGEYVQFVREGDDVAGQESMLISPGMYRDLINYVGFFQADRLQKPHSLRKGFASQLSRLGVERGLIAWVGRWKLKDSLYIYVNYAEGDMVKLSYIYFNAKQDIRFRYDKQFDFDKEESDFLLDHYRNSINHLKI